MNEKNNNNLAFKRFLDEVASTSYPTNTTATGTLTIQQTLRNELRRKGMKALLADLQDLYGEGFDIVETKDGIIIVAENEVDDFTFSGELKTTIKALDFDPFLEASKWEEQEETNAAKKEARAAEKREREQELIKKREAKLAELERRKLLKR